MTGRNCLRAVKALVRVTVSDSFTIRPPSELVHSTKTWTHFEILKRPQVGPGRRVTNRLGEAFASRSLLLLPAHRPMSGRKASRSPSPAARGHTDGSLGLLSMQPDEDAAASLRGYMYQSENRSVICASPVAQVSALARRRLESFS